MRKRLSKEEVVTIQVLSEKNQNHCEIARTLSVTEGTVRYHLRRAAKGAEDGHKNQAMLAVGRSEVIAAWFAERAEDPRPVNVQELWEHLVAEYEYGGSYQSVRRFVRRHYPKPQMRTYRRVETPPGAQTPSPPPTGYSSGPGGEPDRPASEPRRPSTYTVPKTAIQTFVNFCLYRQSIWNQLFTWCPGAELNCRHHNFQRCVRTSPLIILPR